MIILRMHEVFSVAVTLCVFELAIVMCSDLRGKCLVSLLSTVCMSVARYVLRW